MDVLPEQVVDRYSLLAAETGQASEPLLRDILRWMIQTACNLLALRILFKVQSKCRSCYRTSYNVRAGVAFGPRHLRQHSGRRYYIIVLATGIP